MRTGDSHTHADSYTRGHNRYKRETHTLPQLTRLRTAHLTDNSHSDFLRDEKCFRATRRLVMAAQPATEKAYVQIEDRIYKLLRCLPGQRTAASQWFGLFASACRDFGTQQDLMQPTLMLMNNLLYLTVHVDDVFMVGREDKVRELIQYFKEKKQWNVEEKGSLRQGDKFFYLKRQFNLGMRHCDETVRQLRKGGRHLLQILQKDPFGCQLHEEG